jgi:hypothetical protein
VLRPLSGTCGALPATAASPVVGAIPFLAFAGTVTTSQLARLPASSWGQLLFLALGSSVAGMGMWNQAVAINAAATDTEREQIGQRYGIRVVPGRGEPG